MKNIISRVIELAILDLKLYLRLSIAVLWTFIVPILIVLGSGLLLPEQAKVAFGLVFIPGMCALVVITATTLGTITPMIDAREARIYEVLSLFGMGSHEIYAAYLVNRGIIATTILIIVYILGWLLFPVEIHIPLIIQIISLMGGAVLGTILFFNMTISFSMMFKVNTSAHTVASLLVGIMVLAGSCYFDPFVFPVWTHRLIYANPVYQLSELFRSAFGATGCLPDSIAILLLYIGMFSLINIGYADIRHRRNK